MLPLRPYPPAASPTAELSAWMAFSNLCPLTPVPHQSTRNILPPAPGYCTSRCRLDLGTTKLLDLVLGLRSLVCLVHECIRSVGRHLTTLHIWSLPKISISTLTLNNTRALPLSSARSQRLSPSTHTSALCHLPTSTVQPHSAQRRSASQLFCLAPPHLNAFTSLCPSPVRLTDCVPSPAGRQEFLTLCTYTFLSSFIFLIFFSLKKRRSTASSWRRSNNPCLHISALLTDKITPSVISN